MATTTLAGFGRIFRYSENDLKPVAAARIAARVDAPALKKANGFPVVVFSHGLLMYPEQNSALAARLASHGYIVVSIAHPLDAVDQRLADGRVVPPRVPAEKDDPRFPSAFGTLVTATDPAVRREALGVYTEAIGGTRLGRSLVEWREDTLMVARAIVEGRAPTALRGALASADRSRLAFVGMSFGGATAATTCRRVPQCRAAVNLDGQNFDPELFNAPVQRPLLVLLSDWTRYGLFKGQSQEADFSPNDLAYEPWQSTGRSPDVTRVRLAGIRHMGFTDLVALLDGEQRDARVGEIHGMQALSAMNDLVLAFLNIRVRGEDGALLERTLQRHPVLHPHVPSRMMSEGSAGAGRP